MQLAGNNISRYENIFQPQENALVQDANTYSSTPRIQMNMGAAESATGQAANAGRINAEDTLRSYGIDPSSGRYQELETAQRAGAAAAQAGAGQQAELATEATGRSLRTQAIQVGQQYPGQAVNALNAGFQGIAGAENAAIGRANTGVNLANTGAQSNNAAMGLKYPPVGQVSSSQQSSGSQSKQPGDNSGNSQNRSQNGYGTSGSGGYNNPNAINNGPSDSGNLDFPKSNNSGDSFGYTPSGVDPNSQFYDPYSAFPGGGVGSDQSSAQQDPFGGSYSGGNNFYDPYSAGGNFSQFSNDPNTPNIPGGNYGDPNAAPFDPYAGSGGGDYSGGGYDNSGGYAAGGGVLPGPGATTGGHVPVQASPSMGRNTDDISARLNAGEFVIPKDVAAWKGQEFFQKMIEDSRRKRMGAPAKGKSKPALGGQPRFTSQQMPQRPQSQMNMGAQ
jgi:hypothetical protein